MASLHSRRAEGRFLGHDPIATMNTRTPAYVGPRAIRPVSGGDRTRTRGFPPKSAYKGGRQGADSAAMTLPSADLMRFEFPLSGATILL